MTGFTVDMNIEQDSPDNFNCSFSTNLFSLNFLDLGLRNVGHWLIPFDYNLAFWWIPWLLGICLLSLSCFILMILGLIDLTTHDEKTLRAAIEGQVLDNSKNTIITKEEDGFVNFISYRKISNHDSLVELVNQALIAWSFRQK